MATKALAFISCLTAFVPLSAWADSAQPTPTIQAGVPASEPLICHYYYYEGMLIRRGECRPQREWDRLRTDTQRNITEIQIRSLATH